MVSGAGWELFGQRLIYKEVAFGMYNLGSLL